MNAPMEDPILFQDQLLQRLRHLSDSYQKIKIIQVSHLPLNPISAYIVYPLVDNPSSICCIIFSDGRKFIPWEKIQKLGKGMSYISINTYWDVTFHNSAWIPVHAQKAAKIVEVPSTSAEPLLQLKPLVPYDATDIIDPAARVSQIIPTTYITESHIKNLKPWDVFVTAWRTFRTFARREWDMMIFRTQKSLLLNKDWEDTLFKEIKTNKRLSLKAIQELEPGTEIYSVQLQRNVSVVHFDARNNILIIDFEDRRKNIVRDSVWTTGLHILREAA